MYQRFYKGYEITYSLNRPYTGRYRAEKNGVTLSANTEQQLKTMIDTKQDSLRTQQTPVRTYCFFDFNKRSSK